MRHHHIGVDIVIPFFRSIFQYGLVFGKRLEAIFGEEAGFDLVEMGDGVDTLPYPPVMGVAVRVPVDCPAFAFGVRIASVWGGREVERFRIIFLYDFGEQFVEELFVVFAHFL